MSNPSEVLLEVSELQKRYADGTLAVQEITLNVREREFVSIVGPSGCGKTTLLKTICALLAPTKGSVKFNGTLITEPPPQMVLVFQDYSRSLFPWLTVTGNVMFPLRKRKDMTQAEKVQAAQRAIEAVGLSKFHKHFPWQLSGGMQQRVAIARAIAFRPEILLLDEPFASVDALTRADLEDLTLALRDEFGITMLLVTHDIDEAVYLSDRVFVLSTPPSTVLEEIPIPLSQPRDQVGTRSEPGFLQLRNHIHGLIGKKKDDGMKAFVLDATVTRTVEFESETVT
ncbi:MAG: ABC transporter ATP-binding protein [Candidatus Lustribacter sp.]|jgi:NitT/TauT family transport system ATP-binding protein